MRSFRRATLTVALIALVGALLPVAAQAHPSHPIRVANYNMHAGVGVDEQLDLARTARTINASDADVVGLEEVDVHWSARSNYVDQAHELARLTGMRVFFAPIYDLDPEPGRSERRQYGVAVLSRYPIVRAENHWITRMSTLDPDPAPKLAPGFAEAVVAVQGKPVHVYATHLDYRDDPAARSRQVAETMRILDRDRPGARQLLLGDFNATPNAPELAPLLARMSDVWQRVHGPEGGRTYPAREPTERIDYVTTAGDLRPRLASVPHTLASDHRPVLTQLSLG